MKTAPQIMIAFLLCTSLFLAGCSDGGSTKRGATGEKLYVIATVAKVDAICVVPFSVEAVEPVRKKARDRGIVVISHEASSQVNADAIIEPFDNAEYSRHLMDHLA